VLTIRKHHGNARATQSDQGIYPTEQYSKHTIELWFNFHILLGEYINAPQLKHETPIRQPNWRYKSK
jgi:hypothetical protein